MIACLPQLMAARLLFVSGKGGTGKTTIAMALARAAAAQGRRVVLVEVDNQRSSFTGPFSQAPSYQPVNVAPNLWIANVTWSESLEEWLGRFVPAPRLVKLILGNRMVRIFLEVTPGAREVVTFARLQQLMERFDLVVVDMPASGHAVSFFRVFTRASSLFSAGPVRHTMDDALQILAASTTHLVFASLPEEMVVNETIETWQRLREGIPSLSMPLVVLNQGMIPALSSGESVLIERLARQEPDSGEDGLRRAELLRAGRWEAQREQATGEAMERLGQFTTMELLVAPLMGVGGGTADLVRRMEALLLRSGALLAARVEGSP